MRWLMLTLLLVARPSALFAAEPQQPARISQIGVLSFGHPPGGTRRVDPNDGFREGLRALGYVEGRNVIIEWRYAQTRTDLLAQQAAELVRLKVDVILAGGPIVLQAAMKATSSIPIVVVCCSDPVRVGWAQSFARPGGNITGLTVTFPEIGTKRLELLKEVLPGLSRVGVLAEPAEILTFDEFWQDMKSAARTLGVQLQLLEVRRPEDFDKAFADAQQARSQAVLTFDTAKLLFHQMRLVELAARHQLPLAGEFRPLAEAGFLITYGADLSDLSRRAATYVDKILKGAKPGDLPIERPTKFDLVVNLKTAKALGLTIPPSMLLRADEVIQ